MKRMVSVLVVLGALLAIPVSSYAQLKSQTLQPSVTESMFQNPVGSFLGLIDFSRFQMRHSVSLSYMNLGGRGLSVGMYTNSMFYQVSDPLSVRLDVSMMYSPMSSFGPQGQNSLNGIYINRAELNYRPSKDFLLQVQFRQMPFGYYNPYNPYGYGDYGWRGRSLGSWFDMGEEHP